MMPTTWTACLWRARSLSTHNLAHWILEEAFKRRHDRWRADDEEIILSTKATGMLRSTRYRAIDELVALGLIEVKQQGKESHRVVRLLKLPTGWDHAPAALL
jgi:hypothetical protein